MTETLCIWQGEYGVPVECPKRKVTSQSHIICTYKAYCKGQFPKRNYNRKTKYDQQEVL